MNAGRYIEDIVEQLCTASFLADFTVRSPIYRKSGGQTKEAADLLVVFRDTLMVIQVKSKQLKDDIEFTDVVKSRMERMISEAMSQLKAMVEAIGSDDWMKFTNGRGRPVRVENPKFNRIVVLIVYAVVTPDGQLSDTKLRFDESCFPHDSASLHLFSLQDFQCLATVADTVADFMLFLDVRTLLHQEKLIPAETLPIDVWAYAKFEGRRLEAMLRRQTFRNLDGRHEEHMPAVAAMERLGKPGYFVDRLIEDLYRAVGDMASPNPELVEKVKQLESPGSDAAREAMILFLAQLDRQDRTRLVQEFQIRIKRAKRKDIAFGGLKFETHEEGYFLLAMKGPRDERQATLFNLSRSFAHQLGLRRVMALATGAPDLDTSDCDVMLVDTQNMVVDEHLLEIDRAFGRPNGVSLAPKFGSAGGRSRITRRGRKSH